MQDRIDAAAGEPTLQCVQAGDQFIEIERLDQVVVGAGLKPCDPMFHRIACSQYQHRQHASCRSPAFHQLHAVHVGKAQIKDDKIEMSGLQEVLRISSGRDMIDRHRMQAQSCCDAAGDKCIVFYQ
ncbi:hypothetical protein D9M68_872820 [compost metagenome]